MIVDPICFLLLFDLSGPELSDCVLARYLSKCVCDRLQCAANFHVVLKHVASCWGRYHFHSTGIPIFILRFNHSCSDRVVMLLRMLRFLFIVI